MKRSLVNLLLTPLRWALREVIRTLFHVQITGAERLRDIDGETLLVANHVSRIDGLFIYLFIRRDLVFAIDPDSTRSVWVRLAFSLVDTYEMDPQNPLALKGMVKTLKSGRSAMIFPEGRVTATGSLMKTYEAPVLIADLAAAEILPVAIEGLQYSRWSLLAGLVRQTRFPRVRLDVLERRKVSLPPVGDSRKRRGAASLEMLKLMREIAFEATYVESTLYAAIVEAARRHGFKRTIIEDSTGASLTYRQLLLRANVLGQFIAAATERKDSVGIMLPSTAAAIVTLTAVQSRGRRAAMLNFTAGVRGLVIACETADVKVVLTSRKFIQEAGLEEQASALEEITSLVYLEDLRDRVSLMKKLNAALAAFAPNLIYRLREGRPDPNDTAIILFTSGSEGIPKGVVLTHLNVIANRAQVQTLIDLTHRDTVLNVLPMFHAFGLLGGVLLPLFNGARIYCYPSPLHYRIIPALSYKLGATCLFGTNTFLAGYAKYGHPYDFHEMRYVIAGAEKLTDETRRAWSDKFGIRIFEGYGATEASPVIAVNTPMGNKPNTVGQLLAKMSHYIEPVKGIAAGGRLVVRGPNIMRGYLFHGVDGEYYPPSTERGDGWYDTGDIVTVDDEGFVTIVGRHKRFAKIGGEMVSLLQSEDIARHAWPEINHAAVALPDPRKGEQIILLTEYAEADRADLVATAKQLGLPELAVPKRVIHYETLPLLGSGKIDYPSLRDIAKTLLGNN